ncbi:hypothetical protein [Laribacter hongkongensis]|nr:hypothetical protein [Laribacter hongkongensis]MCG9095365.1 hypothetical protein [Laribacter hongkongensis]
MIDAIAQGRAVTLPTPLVANDREVVSGVLLTDEFTLELGKAGLRVQ